MFLILLNTLIWIPSVLGLGFPLWYIFGRLDRHVEKSDLLFFLILGFAALGTATNILHFFIPVTSTVSLIAFSCGWLLFLMRIRNFARLFSSPWEIILPLLIVIIGHLLPSQDPAPDTGLYHLQTIKWINEQVLPIGLANLHYRFGYNHLWFSVAAILSLPGLEMRSYLLLNSLFIFVYFFVVANLVINFFRTRKIRLSDTFLCLTGSLWMMLLVHPKAGSSPDLAILLLTFLSIFIMIRFIEDPRERGYYFFAGSCVLFLALTIKFSAIPLALSSLALIIWTYKKGREATAKLKSVSKFIVLFAMILTIPWLIRNLMLSGCLLYPVTATCFPSLPWTISEKTTRHDISNIRTVARYSTGAHAQKAQGKPWLSGWLRNFFSNSSVIAMAAFTLTGLILLLKQKPALRNVGWTSVKECLTIGLFSLTVGTLFWFFTAPALRFGEGYLWSICFLVLSCGLYIFTKNEKKQAVLILAILVIVNFATFVRHRQTFLDSDFNMMSWPALPRLQLQDNKTADGMRVYTPLKGLKCWDADLPCTPKFDPELKFDKDKKGRFYFYRSDSLIPLLY